MGYNTAIDLAESGLTLEQSIGYHLAGNFYPRVPATMVEPCIQAIQNANTGDWNALVKLPSPITWRGQDEAPTHALVEAHHLDAWIN
jgi:hypothetical protein